MTDEAKEHQDDHDAENEAGDEETPNESPESDAPPKAEKPKPKRKPAWCAVTRIARYSKDGPALDVDEPCRILEEGAVAWQERFQRIDPLGMAKLWGGGRYRVQWHYDNGQLARKDAPVDIPGVSLAPDRDLNPPKEAPAPAPRPPPPEPVPGIGGLGAGFELPKEFAQLGALLSFLDFFDNRAEKKMRGQIDMVKAQSDAFIKQLEANNAAALAREEARSSQALREQEARHKRDREHLAQLAKQTRDATDLDAALARITELENAGDKDPSWVEKIPDLVGATVVDAMQKADQKRRQGGGR